MFYVADQLVTRIPSATSWTRRSHSAGAFPSPPVRALIFMAHRVQRSHFSAFYAMDLFVTLAMEWGGCRATHSINSGALVV